MSDIHYFWILSMGSQLPEEAINKLLFKLLLAPKLNERLAVNVDTVFMINAFNKSKKYKLLSNIIALVSLISLIKFDSGESKWWIKSELVFNIVSNKSE